MNDILSEKDSLALEEILTGVLCVGREQLTPDSRIIEDHSADSLTVTEIIMAVEERFSLSIPDECWEKVRTIGDLQELLAECLKAQGSRGVSRPPAINHQLRTINQEWHPWPDLHRLGSD